jgi:hypothetical protein
MNSRPDFEDIVRMLADDWDQLGRNNVVSGSPAFIASFGVEVLFNELFSSRESVAAAHGDLLQIEQPFCALQHPRGALMARTAACCPDWRAGPS